MATSRGYDTLSWGPFNLNVANVLDKSGQQRSVLVQKRPKKPQVIRFEPPDAEKTSPKANTSLRLVNPPGTTKQRKADHIDNDRASALQLHLTPREILQLHTLRSIQKQAWPTIADEMGHSAHQLRQYWHTQLQRPLQHSPFTQDPQHPLTPLQVLQLQQLVEAGVDWWDMSDILEQPIDVLRAVWHAMMPVHTPHPPSAATAATAAQKNQGHKHKGSQGNQASNIATVGSKTTEDADRADTITLAEALRLAHLKQQNKSWKEIADILQRPQDLLKRVWKEQLEAVVKELGGLSGAKSDKAFGRAAAGGDQNGNKKDNHNGDTSDGSAQGGTRSDGKKKSRTVQFSRASGGQQQKPEWRLSSRELAQLDNVVREERESLWYRISHRFSEATGRFVRPEDIRNQYQV